MGICKTFKCAPTPHAFVFPVVAVNFRTGPELNLSRLWQIMYCPDDIWADDHFNSNELKLITFSGMNHIKWDVRKYRWRVNDHGNCRIKFPVGQVSHKRVTYTHPPTEWVSPVSLWPYDSMYGCCGALWEDVLMDEPHSVSCEEGKFWWPVRILIRSWWSACSISFHCMWWHNSNLMVARVHLNLHLAYLYCKMIWLNC